MFGAFTAIPTKAAFAKLGHNISETGDTSDFLRHPWLIPFLQNFFRFFFPQTFLAGIEGLTRSMIQLDFPWTSFPFPSKPTDPKKTPYFGSVPEKKRDPQNVVSPEVFSRFSRLSFRQKAWAQGVIASFSNGTSSSIHTEQQRSCPKRHGVKGRLTNISKKESVSSHF